MAFPIWTFVSAICTFAVTAIIGKFLVPFLHRVNFGQTILEEGPAWHKSKQGTPTMGGIMFIIGITVVTTACVLLFNATADITIFQFQAQRCTTFVFAGLGLALAHGAIGFVDDYIKVVKKRNLGLTAIQKLVLQFAVTIAYLVVLAMMGYDTATRIPFVPERVDLGWFYYIIAAVVIVGVVNAVNLTDGLDGLDGSLTFFAALFFMLIASYLNYMGVTLFAAAVAGGCLGFLVWNFYPAKCFMGDTGSLFLGGIVCALAFAVDMPILLLPLGIVYLCEIGSVVLQVSYFKLTHGKRLFKMSPIHHHFEMCGWSEVKVVSVFSAVEVVFGVIAFLLVKFGVQI